MMDSIFMSVVRSSLTQPHYIWWGIARLIIYKTQEEEAQMGRDREHRGQILLSRPPKLMRNNPIRVNGVIVR